MSGQGAEKLNRGEAAEFQDIIDRDPEKRIRTLSRKALENAIGEKRGETSALLKMLTDVMRSAREITEGSDSEKVLRDLIGVTEEFRLKLDELRSLYTQDVHKYFGDEEARLTVESLTLDEAYTLIQEIKNRQSDKLLETSSRYSRHSRRSKVSKASSASTTSSAARMRAFAEAAAARESANYERMIAEKEHERKKREAEIERSREEERAEHEKNLAILNAEKKVAVATAKLRAIDEAIEDEEIDEKKEIPGVPIAKSEDRTLNWVHTTTTPEIPRPIANFTHQSTPLRSDSSHTKAHATLHDNNAQATLHDNNAHATQQVFSQPFVSSTPRNITGNQLIESLTSANRQIVAGLARQNLPKCHPDTFNGDPTLFHPWKAAFKAMIADVDVSPIQEINYLRSFTSGEAQKLVDNYRKRKQHDPSTLLVSLWVELERRFGSAAVITKALLERMNKTAAFSENDNVKL